MSQMPTKYRVTHNGEPLALGRVFFTISSGNTPAVTYQNAGLTSANTNPVVLDENGEANVYLDAFTYRETVYDQNGVLIRTRDGIQGDTLTSASADTRYVVKGSASSIGVTTREVISNVRTYVGTLTGFSSYTAGVMIGIIPDVVAVADTAYYININGLGDRRIYSSIGGKPSLTAGVAASLVFDGTNFVVTSSVALLSNQSSLDVVRVGTTETTRVTASVTAGTGKVEATYSGGDSTLVLKGHSVSVDTETDEYFTVNGEPVATRDYVQDELTGNTALWGAISEKIPLSQKGEVFGVAPLDENRRVPAAYLPAIGGSGEVGAFDQIQEFTPNNGVDVDGVKHKDRSISVGSYPVFTQGSESSSVRLGNRGSIWDNLAGSGSTSIARGLQLVGSGSSWNWRQLTDTGGSILQLNDSGVFQFYGTTGTAGNNISTLSKILELKSSVSNLASKLIISADGTADPTLCQLHVKGSNNGDIWNIPFTVESTSTECRIGAKNSLGSGIWRLYTDASTRWVASNGSGTGTIAVEASAFPVNSDVRLKTDLQPITGALEFIRNARTVTGRWVSGEDAGKHSWFIAQDWINHEGVLHIGTPIDGFIPLQMDYKETIPVVAAALKELAEENDMLKSRLSSLEDQIAMLMSGNGS